MNEISIDEKKKISVQILDVIHSFCKENGIQYFLSYGSLLGAVRHEGFIPWDDDIDICMPRPDYEKFLKIFNSDQYQVANYRNSKYFPIPFSKVYSINTIGYIYENFNLGYGVAVDIFPLDGFPQKKNTFFYSRYKILNKLYCITISYNPKLKSIRNSIKKIFRIILPSRNIARRIDMYVSRYNYENSNYVGNILDTRNEQKTEKENFTGHQELNFEGKKYIVPNNYKNVLISLYGEDYMIPPPPENRGTSHVEKYYWC